MDKKKPVFPIDETEEYKVGYVISSTECTGMMHSPPLNEAETDSYTDIYDIPQPRNNPLNDKDKATNKHTGK